MATVAAPAVSARVAQFLSQSPTGLFIGGRWVQPHRAETFDTLDPGTGLRLARVSQAEPEDVDAAVQAAQEAFRSSGWASMSAVERAVHLQRFADLIEQEQETIAEIEALDVGKPLHQARGDAASFPQSLRYYADVAVRIQYREPIAVAHHEAETVRFPYGVCGFVLPWNFPFLLAGWNLSPALAAGNTVVVKPAEDSPLSTLYLGHLAAQAGIPDGVLNIVTGTGEVTGAALARHPGLKRMGFTGSPEVGRLVGECCGRNLVPVKLELGGKGAAVVFDDTNITATVDALTRAVTLNTGQVCCTATRWLVQDRIYDEFVRQAVSRMAEVHIGYWSDPHTEMGPVISRKQMDRVLGYLEKGTAGGAQAVLAGGPAEVAGHPGGFYVKPALLAGDPDNLACREEVFGPVAYLLRFSTEDEAVALVNRSTYGLANSVWTADLDRAGRVARALVAGNSWINAHNVFPMGVPYCGVNLSGMGGGVNSPKTLFDYLRDQSVVRPL